VALTVRSKAAVAPELVEHVVVEGQPGVDLGAPGAVEVEAMARRSSPVVASAVAARLTQHLRQRREEGVVFLRGADGDAQAAVEVLPRGAVAYEDVAAEELCQTSCPSRCSGRNRTKLAPDGHVWTGSGRQLGHQPLALKDDRLDSRSISSAKRRASRRPPAWRIEVVREHDLLQLGHEPRGADEVAEPGAAIDHVLE
jgi:hypothetical protein